MILTFGGKANKPSQDSQSLVSEELRDEQLNKKLQEAFNLKQAREYENSLHCYKAVLNNEFLHALKIKDKDPFIWTRLGHIEFQHLNNLQLAKKCFEAGIQTLTTLEKRSHKINPILIRLAEIELQQFNFKKSEEIVDAILVRQNDKDQTNILFSLIMKAFFLSLKNQPQLSQEFLSKARLIKEDANYCDLEVIRNVNETLQRNQTTKDIVTTDRFDKMKFHYLRINNTQMILEIIPTPKKTCEFLPIIDDFLQQLVKRVESVEFKQLQKSLFNCSSYIQIVTKLLNSNSISNDWNSHLQKYFKSIEDEDNQINKQSESVSQQDTNKQNLPLGGKKVEQSKRMLRKKPDQTEQQLRNYNLEALKQYRDFILKEQQLSDQVLHQIFSIDEVIKAKNYFLMNPNQQSNFNNQDWQSNSAHFERRGTNFEITTLDVSTFHFVLQKCNTKGIIYVLRNLIMYFLDQNCTLKGSQLTNFRNSCYLYRILVILINNDFTLENIEQIGSLQIILIFFELSLYNKLVIKDIKSNALITHRMRLFEYLQKNENLIEDEFQKIQDKLLYNNLQVRYYYSMMFYSFEIKTNMKDSIKYYDKLQYGQIDYSNEIKMPWISPSFYLDQQKISQYGSCKIKEAQIVRNYDENLTKLKLSEIKEMEEKRRKSLEIKNDLKIKAEFTEFASFYLDQFCQYLQRAQQTEQQMNANFSTNEEKILEMWNKLIYSLCRCQTSVLFKLSSHLFSILVSYQYLQKSFYDQFLLKKLEFEPLISEIQERMKVSYENIQRFFQKNDNIGISDYRDILLNQLSKLLEIQQNQVLTFLLKMETHLLRILNNEFVLFNLVSNQQRNADYSLLLLESYFQSLYYIQVFTSFLRSQSSQDAASNLRSVIMLIKHLDKLINKNQDFEIFVKPYMKLLTIAFPFLLQLFCSYLKQNQILTGSISPQNELLNLLDSLMLYFFNLKFNLDDINLTRNDNDENSESEVEEESDESIAALRLKYLHNMKNKSTKQWAASKQANNQSQSQQLFYLTSQGVVNLEFLNNLVFICNVLSEERLLECGKMTVKDISNSVVLLDTLSKHLLENTKPFREVCPHSKNMFMTFKQAYKNNPFQLNQKISQEEYICEETCFYDKPKFKEQLHNLVFFVLNMFAHFGLQSSQFQLASISSKKKTKLFEQIPSLTQGNKQLKNLRQIAQLGIQYNSYSPELILLIGIIQSEVFQLSNNCKQYVNYKQIENYGNYKRFYQYAVNSLIISLNVIQTHPKISDVSYKWKQIGLNGIRKKCVQQLLFLVLTKIDSKQFIDRNLKLLKQYNHDLLVKNKDKLKEYQEQAMVLAHICEKLDRMQVLIEDPRFESHKSDLISDNIREIMQIFLNYVEQSNKNLDSQNKILNNESVNECLEKFSSISTFQKQLDSKQLKISFDFCFIQSMLSKKQIKRESIEMKVEQVSPLVQFSYVENLKKALEIAYLNKHLSGSIDCYIKLLRAALKLGILLKYQRKSITNEIYSQLKDLLDSVNKLLSGNQHVIRFLEEKLCPMTQGQNSGTNETFILELTAASTIRTELMKSSQMPEFDPIENTLYKLYYAGDKIYALMQSQQRIWQKSYLQYILTKSLYEEVLIKNGNIDKISKESLKSIAGMLKQVIQNLNQIEEQGYQESVYEKNEQKNMISSMCQTELRQTTLRIKIKEFYIKLNQDCLDYEPIRDIFKRYYQSYKQYENKGKDSSHKPLEILSMFNVSKDQYIEAICLHIERKLKLFLETRNVLIQNGQNYTQNEKEQSKKSLQAFRQNFQVTKDNIPGILRDIFEIFVDTHIKKSFIQQKKLITDLQKFKIQQSLLKCCAICGPDPEIEQQKITSQFLDFSQITIDEYVSEGLLICIKWYLSVLDERKNLKKEQDFSKKLKVTLDEIEKAIKEALKSCQEQQKQLPFKVFDDADNMKQLNQQDQ